MTTASFPEMVIHSPFPVLVDFWAPRCGPCRQLTPVLEELAAHYAGRLRMVKVNAEESPELLPPFGIRALPALILFQNGHPLELRTGPQTRLDLTEWIDSVMFQESAV